MKTASIFTFQWSDNFGTVLQAYALQEAIRSLGVEADIVPLTPDTQCGIRRFIARTPKALLIKWTRLLASWERDRRAKFNSFRLKFFTYESKGRLSFKRCTTHHFLADYLVFGSDNIWAPDVVQIGQAQGNVFYGKSICHPNKIAYAPSTAGTLADSRHRNRVIEDIRSAGFSAISLRERENVEFFAEHGIDAQLVPDPSLLLDADTWGAVLDDSLCPESSYYFGYDLGHRNEETVSQVIDSLCAKDGSHKLVCYPNDWERTLHKGVAPSPQQWLALIGKAKGIVTNSFHGVMFSIIFNRPFVFLPIVGEYATLNVRARGILEELNAQSHIWTRGCTLASTMATPIDGEVVQRFRRLGLDYLKRSFK